MTGSWVHRAGVEIADAAYAEASARGYEIALSAVANGRPETRAIEALLDVGSEALILIASTLSNQELTEYAREVPVVSLLRDDVGELVDSVSSDDHAGLTLQNIVGLDRRVQAIGRAYGHRHHARLGDDISIWLPMDTPTPPTGNGCAWNRAPRERKS